ncbi:MAG: peptidase S41, partial [Bacteroidia bacterium]|nr:peptidase S41 [Bacteroidia bacterium]
IIPDVFVQINLRMENETINRIRATGIMNYFIFEELDKDRSSYQDITKDQFISSFEISDEVVNKFQDYLNERARYNIPFVAYNNEMKLYLKATLAEQLYGSAAAVQVLNTNDDMLSKVLELSVD